MRLHGKRHKDDRYYFRWHYGKQRVVQMARKYVDKPTERQVSAREAFTELRREVARQLQDAELRSAWMRKFEEDNEGYKMLHTYVYAMMKKSPLQLPPQGESCVAETTKATRATEVTKTTMASMRRGNALVSTSRVQETRHEACSRKKGASTPYAGSELPILVVHDGVIVPVFLPWKVRRREYWQIE